MGKVSKFLNQKYLKHLQEQVDKEKTPEQLEEEKERCAQESLPEILRDSAVVYNGSKFTLHIEDELEDFIKKSPKIDAINVYKPSKREEKKNEKLLSKTDDYLRLVEGEVISIYNNIIKDNEKYIDDRTYDKLFETEEFIKKQLYEIYNLFNSKKTIKYASMYGKVVVEELHMRLDKKYTIEECKLIYKAFKFAFAEHLLKDIHPIQVKNFGTFSIYLHTWSVFRLSKLVERYKEKYFKKGEKFKNNDISIALYPTEEISKFIQNFLPIMKNYTTESRIRKYKQFIKDAGIKLVTQKAELEIFKRIGDIKISK